MFFEYHLRNVNIEEGNMKIFITISIVFALVATLGIPGIGAEEGQKRYTAYNIWRTSKMKCINFKQGYDIIPAGTEVAKIRLMQSQNPFFYFTTVEDGREYTIGFNPRWHPKKKINDYMKMMFTTKNFDDLTMGLNEIEINAIKKGILVNGMSKRAVLISYGIPPEHYTPNQNSKTWYYWMNRRDRVTLTFDVDGMLISGGQ